MKISKLVCLNGLIMQLQFIGDPFLLLCLHLLCAENRAQWPCLIWKWSTAKKTQKILMLWLDTSEIFFILISDWLVVSIQCCFWWKLPSVILWEFYYCRYKLICWCNSIIHRVNIVSALPVLAQNRFRNVFEFKGESYHI